MNKEKTNKDLTTIDAVILVRWGGGIKIKTIDGKKYWLPISQIKTDCGANKIKLPFWLALKKKLI